MADRRHAVLQAIVHGALRHRWVVVALAGLLTGYGLYTVAQAKYDVFPEFAPPRVAVQTEAPGLAPEQVELLVTQPIEIAIQGVPGVQSLQSSSILGLSLVTVVFDPGSDVYRDRPLVAERLGTLAGTLPPGIRAPVMTPPTT